MNTQSQIAIRAAQILSLQSEVIYKWKWNNQVFGIFGKHQHSLDQIRDAVEMATKQNLFDRNRKLDIISARRLFVFFAMKTIKGMILRKIVEYTGFHHATVLYHNAKIRSLIEINDFETMQHFKTICSILHLEFVKAQEVETE